MKRKGALSVGIPTSVPYVVKDSGVCLLVVHVCRTVDRVVCHPRPSLSGIGVPWVSLPGPTDVP